MSMRTSCIKKDNRTRIFADTSGSIHYFFFSAADPFRPYPCLSVSQNLCALCASSEAGVREAQF